MIANAFNAIALGKKATKLILPFWDCFVVLFVLSLLYDYWMFTAEEHSIIPSKTSTWWKYPIRHSEASAGSEIPRLADEDYPQPLQVRTKPIEMFEPPISLRKKRAEKVIAFEHFPMESIDYKLDPSLCGGICYLGVENTFDDADAIVFSMPFPDVLPKRKFSEQLFVWMLLESPARTRDSEKETNVFDKFKHFGSNFNLTMNYRRDADIYLPYNTSYNIHSNLEPKNFKEILEGKTKLAAWIVSNCDLSTGTSMRTQIVLNLMALGLEVDVFGHCVNDPLPGTWMDVPGHLKPYKFYFSFENVLHCRDYITEKLWWNALSAGVVPVIWGPRKKDLIDLLPKNSYIFVEDFKSEKHLVDYLNDLNKNDAKYKEFFKWRFEKELAEPPRRNKFGQPWLNKQVTGLCQLCRLLHEDDNHEQKFGTRPRRIVDSVYDWWYLEETKTCMSSHFILDKVYAKTLTRRLKRQLYYRFWSYEDKKYYVFLNVFALSVLLLYRFKKSFWHLFCKRYL